MTNADVIRVIYESERFPPAKFGYAYDLSDELAAKIRQAFLEFKPKGSSLAKRFEDSLAAKFVAVSYTQGIETAMTAISHEIL